MRSVPIMSVQITHERDVVIARQRARQIAESLGCDTQDQTRVATAVSELARNAYVYAKGGRVEFALERAPGGESLAITVSDRGPGIERIDEVLSGRYRSATGMGAGLTGSRRLMDGFDLQTSTQGTRVRIVKHVPPRRDRADPLTALSRTLAQNAPGDALDEDRRQNRELLAALDELRRRQDEHAELNRELEDTNRGVVALYAELDERAEQLRKADELKTWFLSNMSHEFRTPLNSILALTGLLLDRMDGPLTGEQEKQARLIRTSAAQMLELVNDLLDLAKVRAGRIDVHPAEFSVEVLFGALRATLRPLIPPDSAITLTLADPPEPIILNTDEHKVAQVLRNFISNAIKFTASGTVRVDAAIEKATTGLPEVRFRVTDTGIGIRTEDMDVIFEEFSQIDGPMQRRVKGTGLGLPLSRRLARLLGGKVWAESTPGLGSVFYLQIPARFESSLTADDLHGPIRPRRVSVGRQGTSQ